MRPSTNWGRTKPGHPDDPAFPVLRSARQINGRPAAPQVLDGLALGTNVLNLKDVSVTGAGVINQQGENDATIVSSVTGVDFQINSGVLALENPAGFNGTIGPVGDGLAIGIFGEVDIFNAPSVTKASFDTTSGMLSLLNNAGGDVGNLHFAGTATGLRLSSATFGGAHLAITDGSTAGQGNIPLTFHT